MKNAYLDDIVEDSSEIEMYILARNTKKTYIKYDRNKNNF